MRSKLISEFAYLIPKKGRHFFVAALISNW